MKLTVNQHPYVLSLFRIRIDEGNTVIEESIDYEGLKRIYKEVKWYINEEDLDCD